MGPPEQELKLSEEELSPRGRSQNKTDPLVLLVGWEGRRVLEDILVRGWASTALRKYEFSTAVWAPGNIW